MTTSLSDAIRAVFAARRDHVYLIDHTAKREFTFGQWLDVTTALAAELARSGIAKGDRVALLLPNSWELAAFYFACLGMGAVAMPLNPQTAADTRNYLLRNTGPRAIVGGADLDPAEVPGCIGLTCSLDIRPLKDASIVPAALLGARPAGGLLPALRDDNLFSITFTSGTTERPKGVAHYVSGLFGNAHAFNRLYGFDERTRIAHLFPMTYMAGFLNTLLSPFIAGGSTVLLGQFGPTTALDFWTPLRTHQVNTLWVSPTMLSGVLKLDRDPAGRNWAAANIGTVCVGTAPLPYQLKADFEAAYGVRLYESYGSSELLYVTAMGPADPYVPGAVGRPVDGVTVRIVDQDGAAVAAEGTGEILLQSRHAFAGYWDYAVGAVEPFGRDTWFPTGDAGKLVDGRLYITGRLKDLIIRGGANVSPRAIEEVLHRHPDVVAAAVVGVPDSFYGEDVLAVVQPVAMPADPAPFIKELQALCRKGLSDVEMPRRFELIAEMPRNANGKVLKTDLRAAFSKPR